MKASEIKVLTYNCWHALTAKNLVQFRELEPLGRRLKRYQLQLEKIKEIDADIVFLQEVSPIHDRLLSFESLGYEAVMQVDQSGIKAFGLGLPTNLSTGIMILAKPEFKIKKLFGQKLSGNPGFTGVNFSFQLTENRYALFASSEHPIFGRTLFACTHLHHGTENSPLIEEMLELAVGDRILSSEECEISKSEIHAADLRRRNELDILFSAMHIFEKSFDQIILAGDFNSSESSSAYTQILFENYIDTYRSVHSLNSEASYAGFTWDISENSKNIGYGHQFELPMSSFGRTQVKELFNRYNDRKRRIDFIFLKSLNKKVSSQIGASDLVKLGDQDQEFFGSDHFGVLTRIAKAGGSGEN